MESYTVNQSTQYHGFPTAIQAQQKPITESVKEKDSHLDAEDKVTLSPEAKENSSDSASPSPSTKSTLAQDSDELNQQELAELQKLKQRDAEVRSHEQAHLSAAGQYARGGATYTLQKGPDGSSYAVGGEVGIDVSKEATPEATIAKMQVIKRAALAPANPSGADKRIAAQATAKASQAKQELLQIKQEELLQGENAGSSLLAGEPLDTGKSTEPTPSDRGTLRSKLAIYESMAVID